jgi:hypothetical protein
MVMIAPEKNTLELDVERRKRRFLPLPSEPVSSGLIQPRTQPVAPPPLPPTPQDLRAAQVNNQYAIRPRGAQPPATQTQADIQATMPAFNNRGLIQPRNGPIELPNNPGREVPLPPARFADDAAPLPPGGHMLQQTEARDTVGQIGPRLTASNGMSDAKYVRGVQGPLGSPSLADEYDQAGRLLGPRERAQRQLGPQKRRGVGRILGDIAIGFFAGGLPGAGLGGFKGGDYRYQNQVDERAADIEKADQAERQKLIDSNSIRSRESLIQDREIDNRRADQRAIDQRNEFDKRYGQQQERIDYLQTRDQERATTQERQKKASGYLRMLNQPNQTPAVRAQIASELLKLGYNIPEGYDPTKPNLQLYVDPYSEEMTVIDLTRSTSREITAPDGEGKLTHTAKPVPQQRGASGRGSGKTGSKASEWVVDKDKFTGRIRGRYNKLTNQYESLTPQGYKPVQ